MSRSPAGDRLVLSPMETLVTGGAGNAFERQLQQLYRGGYCHLVVDLRGVCALASAETSLEDLSAQLMSDGAGVKVVAWGRPRGERP
jgi:hypothetical protein